jgi:hypothetical protein
MKSSPKKYHQPLLVGPMKKNRHHPSDAEEKIRLNKLHHRGMKTIAYTIKNLKKIEQYKNRWLVKHKILANMIGNPHKSRVIML